MSARHTKAPTMPRPPVTSTLSAIVSDSPHLSRTGPHVSLGRASVRRNAGGLDDRAPFFEVRPQDLPELAWGARDCFGALAFQHLPNLRQLEHLGEVRVKLFDHRGRRARRGEQAEPRDRVKAGEP